MWGMTLALVILVGTAATQHSTRVSAKNCGGESVESAVHAVVDHGSTSETARLTNYKGEHLRNVRHEHYLKSGAGRAVTWTMRLENDTPCTVLVDWMVYDARVYGDDEHPICCIEVPKELKSYENWSGSRSLSVPESSNRRVLIKINVMP